MTWKMNDQEFKSVQSLSAERRYAYFVKKVADWRQLWGLASESGWGLVRDDQGHEAIPVWPHERLALACATGEWAGHQPRSIDLPAWMERWLPGMSQDGRRVAVFPTATLKGVIVDPEKLKSDLGAELSNYE